MTGADVIPDLPEKLNERLRNLAKGAYAEVKYKDKQHMTREQRRLHSHAYQHKKRFTTRRTTDNYLCIWRIQ